MKKVLAIVLIVAGSVALGGCFGHNTGNPCVGSWPCSNTP